MLVGEVFDAAGSFASGVAGSYGIFGGGPGGGRLVGSDELGGVGLLATGNTAVRGLGLLNGAFFRGAARGLEVNVTTNVGYSAFFTGVAGSRNYFERSVGIGTLTPDAALHVEGSTRAVQGNVSDATGYSAYFRGVAGSRNYFERPVGIGTLAPGFPLHVVGTAYATQLRADFGQPTDASIRFGPPGTDENAGFSSPVDDAVSVITAGIERIRVTAGGSVGIGTIAPGAFLLSVNGNAAKPGGGLWSVFSDRRLKKEIAPLAPGTLDRLLSIHGYTFEYLDEAVEDRLALPGVQTGLIAQEVAEVFPEWVDADEDGFLYVTERGTTALFVEAMRELRAEKDAEIDALRAELSEVEALRAEVAELRAMLRQAIAAAEARR